MCKRTSDLLIVINLLSSHATNTQFRDFFNNLANVDGIWLDMNECANFCDGVCSTEPQSGEVKRDGYSFNPNDPPYYINNRCSHSPLFTRTVAVDAEHYGGVLEYDAHNLYGTWVRGLICDCHPLC